MLGPYLGLDMRAVRATWSSILVVGSVALLFTIRRTLLIFTLAVFLAYLLAPLVKLADYLSRRRFPRALSLGVVYVALLTVLSVVGTWIATQVSTEAATLSARLPELLKSQSTASIPLPSWVEPYRNEVSTWLRQQFESGLEALLPALRTAGLGVLGAIGQLSLGLLIPILSFFLLLEGHEVHDQLMGLLGDNRKGVWGAILLDVHTMIEQYIRSLVVLSIAAFTAYSIFFQLASVPFGVILATLGAVLEFIPVAGWITAAVVSIVMALFSGYAHPGWMVAFFLAYRVFQDYVLQPFLLSSGLALNPLLILLGILAGEQIGGIPGLFLSIPVIATLRIIYAGLQRAQIREAL